MSCFVEADAGIFCGRKPRKDMTKLVPLVSLRCLNWNLPVVSVRPNARNAESLSRMSTTEALARGRLSTALVMVKFTLFLCANSSVQRQFVTINNKIRLRRILLKFEDVWYFGCHNIMNYSKISAVNALFLSKKECRKSKHSD